MLEFIAGLRGVAAFQGAVGTDAMKAIDIHRLAALSGPLATSLGTLADPDMRTAVMVIGSAIFARITASMLAAR
jgi:hypothetical protein